jgi:hypothetical protein
MAIPREYATSNPLVRDALSRIPLPVGTRGGDFVAPDYPVDAEIVDNVTAAEHALNQDDLRAPDAEAKSVRFETGSTSTIRLTERALKTTMDARKIEEAGSRGVNLVADRLAMLRDDILDNKENRIATKALTAANYGASHKDVTGLNFRTIDIYAKVQTWQEADHHWTAASWRTAPSSAATRGTSRVRMRSSTSSSPGRASKAARVT